MLFKHGVMEYLYSSHRKEIKEDGLVATCWTQTADVR